MAVQRAQVEEKRAALREEFGQALLIKKFGEHGAMLVLEAFGVYRSGKHKGEPRGFIHWNKVTVGGWKRDEMGGHVERPGSRDFAVSLDFYRTSKAMPDRDGCLPREASEAEWLLTLSRGLGGMLKQWNYTKDEPCGAFPAAWPEIKAAFDAEKAARLAKMRAEYFAEASQ